jgi:CheY-like chemotaxis protein
MNPLSHTGGTMAKILCVDDDKDILDTCEVILTGQGHTVLTASSGKEGLEAAVKFLPDLIVLDVMMDDLTDGFHAAYNFRKNAVLKYAPILLFSSINEHFPQKFDAKKDGEYLPVDAFLEKPIKPKEFSAKVAELLALKKEQINVDGSRKD